jgi:hypothetical protein
MHAIRQAGLVLSETYEVISFRKKKSAIPIYHLGPRHSLASIHTCLFLLQKQRFLFAYQPLGIANMDDFIQSHDECIQISIHATCKQAKRPLESSWLRAR